MSRLFIKCRSCNSIFFTKHKPFIYRVMNMALHGEVKCDTCGDLLTTMDLTVCGKEEFDNKCDSCPVKFVCFTDTTAEDKLVQVTQNLKKVLTNV
jgi:hypothetical protein